MSNSTWPTTFLELFHRCADRYGSGDRDYPSYYTAADLTFLDSIGYAQREFFDFVEDYCDESVPTPQDALLIAAVRRDYLDVVQKGQKSPNTIPNSSLPPKDSQLAGHRWLPRIITKARAKLRGELDPETMFSCGGDRAFLRDHDIHAADFLRAVWAAGDDEQKIIDYVNRKPD